MALVLSADLTLDLETADGSAVHARLHGGSNRLLLEVDDAGAFAGQRDAPAVRALAEGLAAQGVVVRVVSGGRDLVSLGAVSAPWWQRRVTGSRRIRLGSVRGAFTSARSRARRTQSVLPDVALVPPGTLWPLTPTLRRPVRRPVTTTHDPAHGGAPRLVLAKEDLWAGEELPVYRLRERITIGCGPDSDIRLPGLEQRHAVIEHDERDEYVVTAVDGPVRVHGAFVGEQILRTGTRIDIGAHCLVYFREEYADHGRPHGGRIGGEAGHQRPQPPRDAM
ncbi:FHA domain-containing protein [Nocardioides sp. URHA0020]|uniref:FHA domain-containing protein n=1 Tax=Nocardioides sp. URHA0020 TaxID=1380392 RepID=UPI0006883068|nr:FHA domain-containing protein [Nocardioides sp. URHA0020]